MKTPKTYRLCDAAIRGLEQIRQWYPMSTETEIVEEAISYRLALGPVPVEAERLRKSAIEVLISEYRMRQNRARELYKKYDEALKDGRPSGEVEQLWRDFWMANDTADALLHALDKLA